MAIDPLDMSRSSGKVAIVAGGGPVGVVAAINLAQQGWNVQVFERSSLPNKQPAKDDRRTYNLSLNTRGIRAFRLAGVELDSLIAAQGGRVDLKFFRKDGTILRSESVPVTQEPVVLRVSRDEITRHVLEEAQRLQPGTKFHFEAPIEHVDLIKQIVHVSTASSAGVAQVHYDLLVGADGAASVVRSALQQILPSTYLRRYRHNHVYSTAPVAIDGSTEHPKHACFEAHILQDGTVARDMRADGRNQVGLLVTATQADAIREGDTSQFLAMLDKSAPNLPQPARQAIKDLVASRPHFYPIPSWTYLSQFHGPKTVLLGDAAHTMSPALGQGLNAGLEDVDVFTQCLKDCKGNIDVALPAYTKARLPDIRAIMTINEVVASSDVGVASQDQEFAHKLWIRGHGLLLMVHMIIHTLLHKVAPKAFDEPLLMPMAMGTKAMPYRALLRALYQDGIMLVGILCAVVGCCMRS